MSDSQGPQNDRSIRNNYEARSSAIQQRIRLLVDDLHRLRDQASRVRPSATDSLHRLLRLHIEIRPVIQLLRKNITDYLRASTEWDNAITEYQLHEDRSSWAQAMLQQRNVFFHGLSISTMPLDFQFAQLLEDFTHTLDDIETFIRSDSAPDSSTGGPAEPHSGTAGSTDPATPNSGGAGDRSAKPATRRSSSGIRPVPADQFFRSNQPRTERMQPNARDTCSTSHRSAAVHSPAQQSSTRPSSSGNVLTFVNSLRRGHHGTTGIMNVTDGNVSNAIPMAWRPSVDSGPLYSTAVGSAAQPAARPTQDAPAETAVRSRPARTVNPEHRRRLQQVLVNCPPNGRGPTTGPSTTRLSIGADGQPLHASNEAAATPPNPVDYGVDFGRENSSSFYRSATFTTRAASTGIAPPPLVLRELPLTPFEGNIRRYPLFRNNFVEIIESQRNLESRHKLQYLLQFLRGEPRRLAEAFPISDDSYFTVLDLLEERYGDTTVLRKTLTRDLLQLTPPGNSTASLRQFYDHAFRVTTELHQLGSEVDNDDFYTEVLLGKLTVELRLEIIRSPAYAERSTVSTLLKGLHNHLRILEKVAASDFNLLAQPPRGSTALWSRPPGRFGPANSQGNPNSSNAADANFSYVATTVYTACEFCASRSHEASDCDVYATVDHRLKRLRETKRCFLCLQEGHWSRSCPRQPSPPTLPTDADQRHRALRRKVVQPTPMDNTNNMQRVWHMGPPKWTSTNDGPALPVYQVFPRFRAAIPVPISVTPGDSVGSQAVCAPYGDPKAQAKYSGTDPFQPKEHRTALGRGCTTQPPAATTETRKMEQGTDVSGNDDSLLSRRQPLRTTDKRLMGIETTQGPRGPTGSARAGTASTAYREVRGTLRLRSFEEVSSQGTWSQEIWSPPTSRFDSDAGSTAVPTPATPTAVLVECVKTQASASPSIAAERLDVVSFFDSGSGSSYITRDLLNRLHLQPTHQRLVMMNVFGSALSRSFEATDTTVTLWATDGRPLTLDVIAVETIAASVNTTLVDEVDLALFRANGQAIRPTRLASDILIGQDSIHLFQRQQQPALPHGFSVTTTRLGTVVAGAGRTTLEPSEVAAQLLPSRPRSPLAGHQRHDIPSFYQFRDIMEPPISRQPTRTLAHPAEGRTELPVPQALGSTDTQNTEIHEENCYLCSPIENVYEETQSTASLAVRHISLNVSEQPFHLPQEKHLPLDTTQPLLQALHSTDASSTTSSNICGDAQPSSCAEHLRLPCSPVPATIPTPFQRPSELQLYSALYGIFDALDQLWHTLLQRVPKCCFPKIFLLVPWPLSGYFRRLFGSTHFTLAGFFKFTVRPNAADAPPHASKRSRSRRENLRGLRSHRRYEIAAICRATFDELYARLADVLKNLGALAALSAAWASSLIFWTTRLNLFRISIAKTPTHRFTNLAVFISPNSERISPPSDVVSSALFLAKFCKFLCAFSTFPGATIAMPRSRSHSRNNRRTSQRGTEIPPPTDKWSYWQPADDDSDQDFGGAMRIVGETTNRTTDDSDVLSEATPQAARIADVSTPAHSAGGEMAENSNLAHSAEKEELSAASTSQAAQSLPRPMPCASFLSNRPSTEVDIEFRKRPTRQDTLNEKRTAARTLTQLQTDIDRQSREVIGAYNKTMKHNARFLPQTWSHDWRLDDVTKHLWFEYEDLAPIVAHRQAADMRAVRDRAAAGLSAPTTSSEQLTADTHMETDEPETVSSEVTITSGTHEGAAAQSSLNRTAELSAFYSVATATTSTSHASADSQDSDEEPPYEPLLSPRPREPHPDALRHQKTAEQEVDEMLADFRRAPTPAPATQFRNPSPPAAPAHPAGAAPNPKSSKPAAPAHSVGAAGAAPGEANRSTAPAPKPKLKSTVRVVKKAGHTSAGRDSHTSRSSTGSKRSRVPGDSRHPPNKRHGSRSPTRKPSASLERHIARKQSTKVRHMVPVIDGGVFKDIAIDHAKRPQPFTIWQTAFDSPTCQYELLGVINQLAVPSTHLPVHVCNPVPPNTRMPYADHTFDQALLENTIIPWKFVLCSTVGASPCYWPQTGTTAREYLYAAVSRDKLYRSQLRVRAVGPVGFDLRSGGHLIDGEFQGQLENIVRFGRVARKTKMPLVITIDYEDLPAGKDSLHTEAIKALREGADLSSSHRIHLVGVKATALDLLYWLEQFPRTVISMDLGLLSGINQALANCPPTEELYRHAAALQKFFRHVPMENLGLHSGCPQQYNQQGDIHTPSMLLIAAEEFEKLTGTPKDHLHEHNAANLVAMYDLNPELLDRATTTNDRRDPEIGPRLSRRDLSFVIRTLFGQAPRVDRADQARTRRSPSKRRASIAEYSPTAAGREEHMDTGEAPRRSPARSRSSAAGHRQSRSPSRQAGGRGRSPSRKAVNTNSRKPDQANSAGSGKGKDKPKRGSGPVHPTGQESRRNTQANQGATTSKGKTSQPFPDSRTKFVPIAPQGSSLENRVFKGPPADAQVPRGTADFLAFQENKAEPPAAQSDYGPSELIKLSLGTVPPPRTERPRTLAWCSDSRLFKDHPVHDGNLPDAPSTVEIRAHFEQYLEQGEVEGDRLRQVFPGSLATIAIQLTHSETIEITTIPGPNPSPFDPTQPCGCKNTNLHQTVDKYGLVSKKKWCGKVVVQADKTGNGMKWLLTEVMKFKVETFGQMIFLKYATRLAGNGPQTGAVLRFIYEVLQTTDWIGLIDLLREAQHRMVLTNTTSPWPSLNDVYSAAETWANYCPEAYAYVFSRLSGTITFEPDWNSYRIAPTALSEMLAAVNGTDLFDMLRHRLYSEYCLPLIHALEEHRAEIHWTRCDINMKSKRDLCLLETHETICFVDDVTYEQYADNIKETSVKMIRIVVNSPESTLGEVRDRHPTSAVKRVVFWMSHGFLLEGGNNLCILLSELVHHYEEHYPNIEKYVVMPPYIRRRRVHWTDHVLGTYLQRDEILPNTRVVLLPGDLQLWDFDRRQYEAGKPLPAWRWNFVDEEGRCLSDPYLAIKRLHLRRDHGLDLWNEIDELGTSDSGAPAHPAAEPEPVPSTSGLSTGSAAHPAAKPGTSAAVPAQGDDFTAFITAGLPAGVVTPEVAARIQLATEVLRTKIAAEAAERAAKEMQPKLDKVEALYEYILQQEQQNIPQKIAKKPERSRSGSRSPMDPESEH